MSVAIDRYLEHVRSRAELASSTIDTLEYRLHGLLRDVETDRPLRALTPKVARQLYERRSKERAADTHIGELNAAIGMFDWCVKQGWFDANPFADVEPVGKRSARRSKLRIKETRAFVDYALAEHTPAGLAAAMAVMMGMRATEITSRTVRDIDDGCRVLWIDTESGTELKTEDSERYLEIPEDLRPYVLRVIANRPPAARLFPDTDRHWLRYHVQRISAAVTGSKFTTQALRRTHAKIAAGLVSVDHVAKAIGHKAGSPVTRKHYIGRDGVEQRRATEAVLQVLNGGRR